MLIVLRHSITQWNIPPRRCQGQTDVPLSDKGRAAARLIGGELTLPDAVYSSHMARAQETAEILLKAAAARDGERPPTIGIDPRLAEAFCGAWEGTPHDELRNRWPEHWRALRCNDPGFCFPEGESLEQVRKRFTDALDELDKRHADQTALVVTHGGPMRLFLDAHGGMDRSSEPGRPPRNLEGFWFFSGEVSCPLLQDDLLHHEKGISRSIG